MAGKGKNKVRYLSEQEMVCETGLSPELVHQTFEAIWDGYPRLHIKHKTGELVWQSPTTTGTFIDLATCIRKGTYAKFLCPHKDKVPPQGEAPSQGQAPQVTVPIMEFAKACEESIGQARNIVPLRGVRSQRRQGLARFMLDVEAGGTVAGIRLDHACAIVKRMPHLPLDAYGEAIAGAMTDSTGRRWIVAYDLSEQLGPDSPDAGNIDHLVPRCAGGSSSLCNLHVMRLQNNSRKSDTPMPDISGEPQACIRALRMLAAGCHRALDEQRMEESLGHLLLYIIHEDLSACMDMIPMRELIATTIGAVAREATAHGRRGRPMARGASVARVARRMLSRAASDAIVSA